MILPNEIDISDHGVTPKSKIQMFYRFHGSIISLTLNHKPVSRKFPLKTTVVRFETSSRLKFSVHFFGSDQCGPFEPNHSNSPICP